MRVAGGSEWGAVGWGLRNGEADLHKGCCTSAYGVRMSVQPRLETERLLLRPFGMEDAADVAALAGDETVAAMTLLIPHPYVLRHAIDWIGTHADMHAAGRSSQFAVVDRGRGELVGAMGIDFMPRHAKAEIGYWIGRPFWGTGYATEAGRAVVRWAFEERGVERVESFCFTSNAASARVLRKIGLVEEGLARGYMKKGEARVDCVLFGVVRGEWSSTR